MADRKGAKACHGEESLETHLGVGLNTEDTIGNLESLPDNNIESISRPGGLGFIPAFRARNHNWKDPAVRSI